MNSKRTSRIAAAALLVASVTAAARASEPAPLPAYTPQPGPLLGRFTSIGSDTLIYLMSFWTVKFKQLHTDVEAWVEGAGSATAPPALASGEANFGPMSRTMKANEKKTFVEKYGYEPTAIRVALDALAVYVHRDNPIRGLTLAQIDAIFSTTRKCGYGEDIAAWRQLGLNGEWQARDIALYGRNLLSGTRVYFAENALCKGRYKESLQMQSSSLNVVQRVATHIDAIGYSGIGYKTADVRALPIAAKEGEPFVEPTAENVERGRYPLARYLYVYINKKPGEVLPPLEREFLKMVLSETGQWYVQNDGFIPLSATVVAAERAKLY